jgi:hypothetical protein
VVFSCFRLHGPAFTRKVQAMRAAHAERVAAR